jgi:predicted ATPase
MSERSSSGIGADEASAPTTGGNNLPSATTRIVGRRQIINLINQDVMDARLVAIVGAGGIGKTTVALAVAEQAIREFRDGVWFIDFAPLKDAALVPNAIAAATGLVVHSANVQAALCRYLRDRETLLVLDNCEHMIDAIATSVAQILDEGPRVHVLATSRAPLCVSGELVHRLPGLATPPVSSRLTAENALAFPAIQLFVDRATDRLESFTLSDADAPVVAEICRTLDGIALAIELAAIRVDVFGVGGLHRQLDDRFRLLGGRRAGLERHRTLAATLDWSYSLLRMDEAALLRAVSVFAGVFRAGDASTVANMSADNAGTVLAELAAKSLLAVDVDTDTGEATYRLLETARAYCLDKLLASAEHRPVRLRHAGHVATVIERAAGGLALQSARDRSTAFGRYIDDLRAALAWAGTDPADRPLLIRLTMAGTALWNHFSLTDESRTHLKRAIAEIGEAGAAGTAVEMHLQLALAGAALYTRGMGSDVREAMWRAHDISVQLGDTEFRLRCLRVIGTYQLFNGENEAGIRTLETFVAIAATQDPSAVPEGETHLGVGELFVGRLRAVRQRLERLYAQDMQDLDDAQSLQFLYNNSINVMVVLSHAQWLTGSPDAAERMAAMVVEHGLKARHELSLSIGLAWVCLLYFWTGRDEECSRYTAMLDDLVERHGIVTWRPIVIFCRGAMASRHEGTLAEGIKDLERAVAECRAMGHMARLPHYIGVLADALARQGRLSEAEATIRDALDLATHQNDRWCVPELLRIEALIRGAGGQPDEPEAMLNKSMALAEEVGAQSWRLRAAIDLARLWQVQSRSRDARHLLQSVYDAFTEGFQTRDLQTAGRLLAELQ